MKKIYIHILLLLIPASSVMHGMEHGTDEEREKLLPTTGLPSNDTRSLGRGFYKGWGFTFRKSREVLQPDNKTKKFAAELYKNIKKECFDDTYAAYNEQRKELSSEKKMFCDNYIAKKMFEEFIPKIKKDDSPIFLYEPIDNISKLALMLQNVSVDHMKMKQNLNRWLEDSKHTKQAILAQYVALETMSRDHNLASIKKIDFLIKSLEGCSVNAADENGRTLLGWAAHNGNKEVVQYLLKQGANKGIADGQGKTPRELAEKSKSTGNSQDS